MRATARPANNELVNIRLRTLLKNRFEIETMTDSSASAATNYIEAHLPPSIVEKLEAGAFRSLCSHLKERSDEVQNLDLMTISGFCRNCLAKWMVVEARKLSKDESDENLQALDALGYDEAAQYVYGCDYGDWKKKHAKKASDEQMQKYNDSMPLHSVFDKMLLATKAEKPSVPMCLPAAPSTSDEKKSLFSNVCCQDVDDEPTAAPQPKAPDTKKSRTLPPFVPPKPPTGGVTFSIAVITVSDRAFKNEYESGDLSGPAVEQAVRQCVETLITQETPIHCDILPTSIVPDEMEQIQSKIRECADAGVDLVLTTGGTGFAPRDVTPEATVAVMDRECHGLMAFVTTECSKHQPLASLSRGTAGLLGMTMICNLPGNPKGVGEIVPILLPVVLHGIRDLQATI